MTDCNGCGACCDPVVLPYGQVQVLEAGPHAFEHVEDWVFIINDLERIPYREGRAKSPHLTEGGRTTFALGQDGDPIVMASAFYRCKHFDEDTRRCTNYENRPPLCRSYPWYGDPPDPNKAIPFECSYNEDVGRPVRVTIGKKD